MEPTSFIPVMVACVKTNLLDRLEKLCGQRRWQVLRANTVGEALRASAASDVRVLVVQVSRQRPDGLDLLRALETTGRRSKLVGVGLADEWLERQARAAGARWYFSIDNLPLLVMLVDAAQHEGEPEPIRESKPAQALRPWSRKVAGRSSASLDKGMAAS